MTDHFREGEREGTEGRYLPKQMGIMEGGGWGWACLWTVWTCVKFAALAIPLVNLSWGIDGSRGNLLAKGRKGLGDGM